MTISTTPRGSKGGRKRPPHNAKLTEHASFDEMLTKAANEPRKAELNQLEVNLTRAERLFRLTIDRALADHPRDLADVLRRMEKYPQLAASYREETTYYVNGAAADL